MGDQGELLSSLLTATALELAQEQERRFRNPSALAKSSVALSDGHLLLPRLGSDLT